MKPKIQAAMYRCKSWDEFQHRLAPAGITVQFYNDRDTGKPQGLKDAAERLRERMYSIVNGAVWAAIPKRAYAAVIAVFGIAVGLGIW